MDIPLPRTSHWGMADLTTAKANLITTLETLLAGGIQSYTKDGQTVSRFNPETLMRAFLKINAIDEGSASTASRNTHAEVVP